MQKLAQNTQIIYDSILFLIKQDNLEIITCMSILIKIADI